MPAQTVNSAYQETEELKILTEEIGKLFKLFTVNLHKTPHQISPTKFSEQQFHLKLYIDLTA